MLLSMFKRIRTAMIGHPRRLFAIGVFPPPVHGFSVITEAVTQKLEALTSVHRCDRSPALLRNAARSFVLDLGLTSLRIIALSWSVLCNQPKSIYLGLSAGLGIYIDFFYMLVCRLSSPTYFIHHHNFTYLDDDHIGVRWINKFFPNAKHIVLCSAMSDLLSKRYNIPESHITILSNTLFAPDWSVGPLTNDAAVSVGLEVSARKTL